MLLQRGIRWNIHLASPLPRHAPRGRTVNGGRPMVRSLDETEQQTTWTKKVRQPIDNDDTRWAILKSSLNVDELLDTLAGKLNSNEEVHPEDGFQLDLTLLRPMGSGSGHGKRLNPGRMGVAMSMKVLSRCKPFFVIFRGPDAHHKIILLKKYPVGHPEIIFNPSLEECEEYFGLAKVDIRPPPAFIMKRAAEPEETYFSDEDG